MDGFTTFKTHNVANSADARSRAAELATLDNRTRNDKGE